MLPRSQYYVLSFLAYIKTFLSIAQCALASIELFDKAGAGHFSGKYFVKIAYI